MKKYGAIILAVLILAIFIFLPSPLGLSKAGKNTIGLAVFFLILLIKQPVPLPVICLLLVALMPLVGAVSTLSEALEGYKSTVLYFTIASFCLSTAFISVPLSNRILKMILKTFAKSTNKLIFGMMICAALVSSVVSNIPTTAVFIALGTGILATIKNEEKKKSIGRALMISVVLASMIGGMMTPAGSSLNMLGIGLLQKSTGITITFIQWMMVGIPVVLVMIPLAWLLIVRIYKPAELSGDEMTDCINAVEKPGRMESNELFFLILFTSTVVLWILSSWVAVLDVNIIAIISACICFFPGLRILSEKSFESMAHWDIFFVQGAAISLGLAMIGTGVDKWFIQFAFSSLDPLPLYILVALCALFVFFMLLLIPVAPAMISFFSAGFIALADAQGVSPVVTILVLTMCTANCYLLPLDSVPLLGLNTGYFSIPDIAKTSVFLQLSAVCLLGLWLPNICRWLSII